MFHKIKFKKRRNINTESELQTEGHIKIDWGRQGGFILGLVVIILGYYGIIINTVMFDEYGNWISYLDMDRTVFIWTYETYLTTFFLPAILLFIVCLLLTYKEDIPHYGIKASLWLVPIIITEGFLFYFIMFGFSLEPYVLQFANIKGYLNVLILYGLTLTGSITGMKLKQWAVKRKNLSNVTI